MNYNRLAPLILFQLLTRIHNGKLKHNGKLDIQNIYKCVEYMMNLQPNNQQNSHTQNLWKINLIYYLFEWQKILGKGFTIYSPNKLNGILVKHISKLQKNICFKKQFNIMNIGSMISALQTYTSYASIIWLEYGKSALKKLDKTYYEFAISQLEKYIKNQNIKHL